MKVFISWSGERSRQVAELLDDWIQCVIQVVDPWMSSKDIDRGALWFTEISDQLAATGVGIVCLTKENKNKPWILFESGALAKGLNSNRVCTFLIDLTPNDLENPLAQFNHTFPTKEGVWELVRTINLTLKDRALKESILEKVFNTYWPQFESKFSTIIINTPENENLEKRDESDIMGDVLSTVRMLDRRLRNMESFNRNKLQSADSNHINRRELLQLIKDHLDAGFTKDFIKQLLKDKYNIPNITIAREIDAILNMQNEAEGE
ncbi:TIR domain-containing protein [Chryseobacterium binzhouense]|uniref:TIR domain-containing protein n=1 Tax=Chryseobacterium binzhouense TaxID=2593646 RepID=UPI00117F85B6|nr:TIR domain-containing protein [Chryseobacterium binzhouense]